MASPALKIDRPYARARNFARMFRTLSLDDQRRLVPARQTRSEYRRIASIGDTWGTQLDELGACHAMVRWVAGARTVGELAQQERRFRALAAFLRGGGQWKEFGALAAQFPKLGHQAAGAHAA